MVDAGESPDRERGGGGGERKSPGARPACGAQRGASVSHSGKMRAGARGDAADLRAGTRSQRFLSARQLLTSRVRDKACCNLD